MYLLPEYLHFAVCGRHVVFLDLRSDRYFAAPSVYDSQPEASNDGLVKLSRSVSTDVLSTEQINKLAKSHELREQSDEADSEPRWYRRPVSGRRFSLKSGEQKPTAIRVAAFFVAVALADLTLKSRTIEEIMVKEARRAQKTSKAPADSARSQELAATFSYLLPFSPGKRVCLRDSYRLLTYLRLFGVNATWVWGVKTAPFEAHCWLQSDAVALNDDIEMIERFTPILVA